MISPSFCNVSGEPTSRVTQVRAIGDANLRTVARGEHIQLERKGYYICDRPFVNSGLLPMVLIEIPDGRGGGLGLTKAGAPRAP